MKSILLHHHLKNKINAAKGPQSLVVPNMEKVIDYKGKAICVDSVNLDLNHSVELFVKNDVIIQENSPTYNFKELKKLVVTQEN